MSNIRTYFSKPGNKIKTPHVWIAWIKREAKAENLNWEYKIRSIYSA